MIGVRGSSFVDEHGRILMLRGVNLGGSSKVPRRPDGATHLREGFFDHRDVSFVGRPFPLEEADEHFTRLRAWGLELVRLVVTWEAIEHAGPGRHDEAYLDYLRAVAERAEAHGISLLIDPHQDMWSRWSGGDGAPGWTLEAVGFDLRSLDAVGAAVTHQVRGDPLPRMIWPTNGGKLAAATMFTLFFGGNDFAPKIRVDGEPVQEFLQRHYLGAFAAVAERLKGLANVVGYGTMNEPLCGYIGWGNLNVPCGQITLGDGPTPFQGMLLGAGIAQEVGVWTMGIASIRRSGTRLLDPGGARAWRPGFDCVWRRSGVWDLEASGAPVLLAPEHFVRVGGRRVGFAEDYYRPFAQRFLRTIRSVEPRALIFVEAESGHLPPLWEDGGSSGLVFAPHQYDDLTLVKKRYVGPAAVDPVSLRLVLGRRAVRRALREGLERFKRGSRELLGGAPSLLAEFGIPFDLDAGRAYRTGDFRSQVLALDRSYRAVEDAMIDSTIWNYTADNTNARGDQWNGEDLSIFSRDQQDDPDDVNSGGRALQALLRPYPRATAGTPLGLSFDIRRRVLRFTFRHDPLVEAPTEIFVPAWQYPEGYDVSVSDGTFERRAAEQVLIYRHGTGRSDHLVQVSPRSMPRASAARGSP